jgi:hypothetical protein
MNSKELAALIDACLKDGGLVLSKSENSTKNVGKKPSLVLAETLRLRSGGRI